MRIRNKIASVGIVGLLAASASAISIESAHASTSGSGCHQYGTNKSAAFADARGTVPYHFGPYGACASKPHKGRMYIWCKVKNSKGNTFYYGRDADSNGMGWVYSANLTHFAGGSTPYC